MKKNGRIFLYTICAAAAVWCAMFSIDCIRCSSLREPLFVIAKSVTADDGGSGSYQGLGYTVEVKKYLDPEYGSCVRAVELTMLGKVIVASIS